MSVSYRVRSAASIVSDLAAFGLGRTELNEVFARSPLAAPPPPGPCPACSGGTSPLLRMPLGCPESPGDRRSTLMWLADAEALIADPARASQAARASGLRLSVPWNRCPDCGTAAVGVHHLAGEPVRDPATALVKQRGHSRPNARLVILEINHKLT